MARLLLACALLLVSQHSLLPAAAEPAAQRAALAPRRWLLDAAVPAEVVPAAESAPLELKQEEKQELVDEEVLRGPEKEAEIEEEIMEFEEEGGLAVSLVVWVLALVGPLALLVYLRLKTSLLGATPPASSGSAVLSALEGASKGAAAGPAGKEVKAAEVPSAAALSKAALLRQLEEENIRLRQQSAPSAK